MNQDAVGVLIAGGPSESGVDSRCPELPCSLWSDPASAPSTLDGEQACPHCPLIVLVLLPQAWDMAHADRPWISLHREPRSSSLWPP